MLGQIDVLSVPTIYRDPKGLYVLESLAAGVPVVQPAHGAFPELIEATGGGKLVPPADSRQLAAGLHQLLIDQPLRQQLAFAAVARPCISDTMPRQWPSRCSTCCGTPGIRRHRGARRGHTQRSPAFQPLAARTTAIRLKRHSLLSQRNHDRVEACYRGGTFTGGQSCRSSVDHVEREESRACRIPPTPRSLPA